MVSSTHHLDFHRQINHILANILKIEPYLLLLLQNPLFLDPIPVEGQHTELLVCNQGIYLL